jgi:hypothetical protein
MSTVLHKAYIDKIYNKNMLNSSTIEKIENFISEKPRSIQEISNMLNKNWRTADRYIDQIIKERGTINTRVFRKGTRGALKIVYWSALENRSHSIFQKELENQILNAKEKNQFSAFDIFQYIPDKNKEAYRKVAKDEVSIGKLREFQNFLMSTKKQLLFFSGNLSFINYKTKEIDIFNTLETLAKKGISIKALCRVNIKRKENIKKLLSLNKKYAKEIVEIRHREQPLRLTISDSKKFNIKEIKNPTNKIKELSKKTYIIYTIKDKSWAKWLTSLFYKMFNNSIDANKRLIELNKIKQ